MRYSIFALLIILFVTKCKIDHGLGTIDSKITGNVIFLNMESKPDNVESVRVIAAINVPPKDLGDVVFTYSSVNLSTPKYSYELPAPLADYKVVAAVWKEKNKAWNYANILGFYGFDPINYTVDYKQVELSKTRPIAKNIDIYCDWSLISNE